MRMLGPAAGEPPSAPWYGHSYTVAIGVASGRVLRLMRSLAEGRRDVVEAEARGLGYPPHKDAQPTE